MKLYTISPRGLHVVKIFYKRINVACIISSITHCLVLSIQCLFLVIEVPAYILVLVEQSGCILSTLGAAVGCC